MLTGRRVPAAAWPLRRIRRLNSTFSRTPWPRGSMRDLLAELAEALEGRYELVRELGRGGMATVFLARDRKHHRLVAVKVLDPKHPAMVGAERFLQEIEITAGFNHPNILSLFDSGLAGDLVYFVMPHVEGESLHDRLAREGPLPAHTAISIALEVADALGYAHARGVVHRDIKPSNILLSGSHAFVTDFGIARALTPGESRVETETGVYLGTPSYMSPEQACGSEQIDGRSDLYSLGCVLHEMLAGQPPFPGSTPQAILSKHLTEPPPPLTLYRPELPAALEQTVEQCLRKLPADRFQTAHDLAEALVGADAAKMPRWPGEGAQPDASRTGKRRRGIGALASIPWWLKVGAMVLALAGVTGAVAWSARISWQRDLDPNRIMVFPLTGGSWMDGPTDMEDPGPGGRYGAAGEDVATVVGFALEGSEPLVWLEAKDWMDPQALQAPGALSLRDKRRIARSGEAAFMVDGSIVPLGDSVTLILRLHDVAGGTLLSRSGASASAATASPAHLGLRAVLELLPTLLEPGRKADVLALNERDPASIASWLHGERAYRHSRFAEALEHFERALTRDSALALAAVGAAQVHSRLSHLEDAARFASAAVRFEESLPLRHQHFIRALDHYLTGAADSADARIAAALALKPDWAEAWELRGAINLRLLRHPSSAESLVADSYERAYELDPELPTTLIHLAEMAARRGALGLADSLASRYTALGAEPGFLHRLETELRCARHGPDLVDWEARIRERPTQVVLAGVQLISVIDRPDCAERAWKEVLQAPGVAATDSWGAFLGLSSLLAQQDRHAELEGLLGSEWARTNLAGDRMFLLFAAFHPALGHRAQEVFEGLRGGIEQQNNPLRWLYGLWAFRAGETQEMERVAQAAREAARTSDRRRDHLIADELEAWTLLAAGDTVRALEALEALEPSGLRNNLLWDPWESLGPERIQLAELLLAAGEYRKAIHVAQWMDHPQPIIYHAFQPRSLEIREEASRRLGLGQMADDFRRRREALRFR